MNKVTTSSKEKYELDQSTKAWSGEGEVYHVKGKEETWVMILNDTSMQMQLDVDMRIAQSSGKYGASYPQRKVYDRNRFVGYMFYDYDPDPPKPQPVPAPTPTKKRNRSGLIGPIICLAITLAQIFFVHPFVYTSFAAGCCVEETFAKLMWLSLHGLTQAIIGALFSLVLCGFGNRGALGGVKFTILYVVGIILADLALAIVVAIIVNIATILAMMATLVFAVVFFVVFIRVLAGLMKKL